MVHREAVQPRCPAFKSARFPGTHFETSPKGRTFSSAYVPIRDENGNVIAGLLVSHDISALKQAEEGLRRMHDELEIRVRSERP